MNLILFLCKEYSSATHIFCNLLNKNFDYNAKMIVDRNDLDLSQYTNNELIQVSDELCIERGFFNSFGGNKNCLIKKNPISWDKAIYYLSTKKFNKAIIIEDDCLVLNPKIFDKFFKIDFDLLSPSHHSRIGNVKDWHWKEIEKNIDPPYFYSMVCCIGVSSKLIDKIIEHKNQKKSLFYAEAMFNTIAQKNNLKIKTPKELSSIVALGNWNQSFFKIFKNNIFHPVKNIEMHKFYRFKNLMPLRNCCINQVEIVSPKPFQETLIPKFLLR